MGRGKGPPRHQNIRGHIVEIPRDIERDLMRFNVLAELQPQIGAHHGATIGNVDPLSRALHQGQGRLINQGQDGGDRPIHMQINRAIGRTFGNIIDIDDGAGQIDHLSIRRGDDPRLQRHHKALLRQGDIAAALGGVGHGFHEPHLAPLKPVGQLKTRLLPRLQTQRRMGVARKAKGDVLRHPFARFGHDGHGPQA